ncbi:6-bladed beta-propeller [Rhodonellum sp.]|uniref:6-bladed beta-propeller n=1 Tax=Rhodonellum sp. TaxID=2231180 RepID=UPI0027240243|nr:6-bladed beta-propeller [Rhodonellum sp.]MDO9552022.1 6-bladed beta-propeller [Rhodonellum sp.]
MKHLNLILFGFLVLLSCNQSNQGPYSDLDLKTIQVNNENDILPEGTLSLESTVPLEFCEDCIVGMVDKILVDDSGYYVLDKTITKSITKFGKEGQFIFRIESQGDGLGKYILPFDFELEIEKDAIAILDVNQRKVLFFHSSNGEFINEGRYGEFQAMRFSHVGGDQYAFHLDGREFGEGKHDLGIIADIHKKEILNAGVFDFGNTDYMAVDQEFTRGDLGVLFAKSMNDTVYQVTEKGYQPKFVFDFGNRKMTDDIRNADVMEARQKIMTTWPFFHWGRVFENREWVFFLWSGDNGERRLSAFNQKENKNYGIESEELSAKNLFHVEENRVYAFLNPEEYSEKSLVDNPDKDRNPTILIFSLN